MTTLHINGRAQQVDLPDETPLLWALRDELGHTGTKFGCGMALCGSCTVHVDGQATRSCTLPIGTAKNHKITTIEGMENDRVGRVVQDAWTELGVAQCGYCQAGQIMATVDLLKRKAQPSDADISQLTNLCRCGTYPRIRKAVKRAAQLMVEAKAVEEKAAEAKS